MTDVLEVHFLNMVKFRKLKHKDIHNPLERWMTFFNIKTPETELQEVINMDMAIQKAFDKIKYATQDKELLRQYYLHEMALSDRTTEMDTAIEKREIEIAKNLLNEGLSIEFVHKNTGLNIEILQTLK
jgi:predicted transposase/invertase (TIGR01784 family)